MTEIRKLLMEKGITGKKLKVLEGIGQNKTLKEIGYDIGMSFNSVNYHHQTAIKKLGAKSAAHLKCYLIYLTDTGKELDWSFVQKQIDKRDEAFKCLQKQVESKINP